MTPLLAALAAMSLLGGLLLVVIGARPQPVVARPASAMLSSRVQARLATGRGARLMGLGRRSVTVLAASVGVGFVVAVLTGWVVAVLLVPAAAVGLPALLRAAPAKSSIARAEAMEEWTRSLAGVLGAGMGIEQALIATLKSTPDAIRPEVSTLVARLRGRWPVREALRAFADDLDDATGDLIAAALLIGADRRGTGLEPVLEALAKTVAEDVSVRRSIEADRDKPRANARWITAITVGALVVMALTGSYLAPYGTPLGQVALLLLLTVHTGALIWMRRMARGAPLPRFIGDTIASPQKGRTS